MKDSLIQASDVARANVQQAGRSHMDLMTTQLNQLNMEGLYVTNRKGTVTIRNFLEPNFIFGLRGV